jgi:hypothetical protein
MTSSVHTAAQAWDELHGDKDTFLTRCERYASLTIPKLCLPDGFDVESTDQTHDYQSIGAQAVNALTNKFMLALFAPSRPFFRVEPGEKTRAKMAVNGMDEKVVAAALGQMERSAVKELDRRGQRPKLYAVIKNLIVLGNVLLVLEKDTMRVMGIRYFCVKRCADGSLHSLVIKECVKFNELDEKARKALPNLYQDDTEVSHYRWIKRQDNGGKEPDYVMTQWVDMHQLPQEEFGGKWPESKLPYRVLTWDLTDEADYGTGLVEEYSGDLEALSTLSEAIVNGAVLGAEFRWTVDPTSMMSVEDVRDSVNGDVLAGKKDDLQMVTGGNPSSIETAAKVSERYERRVSLGFLMQGATTRDAERVTAEEIRMQANELETSFGGTYSVLANNIQKPIAEWLLKTIKVPEGMDLELSIITGLDALSRNGDLEALRLCLMDLAQITALPEDLQGRIKYQTIVDFIGNGRGIDFASFLKTEDEYQAWLDQQAAARVQESNAVEAGAAGAQAAVQPQGV